jgi:hypothetical protein
LNIHVSEGNGVLTRVQVNTTGHTLQYVRVVLPCCHVRQVGMTTTEVWTNGVNGFHVRIGGMVLVCTDGGKIGMAATEVWTNGIHGLCIRVSLLVNGVSSHV